MSVTAPPAHVPGFEPDEIQTGESTRNARLKWVVVVDSAVPTGRMVNAVACIAASTGQAVTGLIGPGGTDADGAYHPGLPWAGASILAATADQLAALRTKAVATLGVHVCDMPTSAQTNRVYDDYLAELGKTPPDELALTAVGIIGPRNAIDRLTKKLHLLA